MNSIADIDRAIAAAALPECAVIREAGLSLRYLYNIRTGRKKLTRLTIKRVENAIAELRRRQKLQAREKQSNGREAWRSTVAAQYRMSIALVAIAAGVSPRFLLDADPARRATADPEWLRAARLRRIAIYVANQFIPEVEQADLARAAGMSKANVCVTIKQLEDMRGDEELERIITVVEEAFQ